MLIEWIVAAAAFVGSMLLLPSLLRRSKRASTKGGGSGVTIALGLAFAMIFDPKMAQAMEIVDRKTDAGEAEDDAAGELP